MPQVHSTIDTTPPGSPILRYECPACGFLLETTRDGYAPLIVDAGDSRVGHTGDWQRFPVLAHR